jgi:rfaE bifunctional protein nucleotidyltransferase chain/domain
LEKRKPLPQLQKIIAAEKAAGRTVVLANGCFDLFHVGHIRYLREARSRGDILVVAVNSDSSVRRLKGQARPILPQSERAEILASFAFVDYVTIFREPNVEKVLLALEPTIHIKGSDYTKDTVPEKDTVKKYGGKVGIAGGPKVRSTSEIIKMIAGRLKKGQRKKATSSWKSS